MFLLWLPPSLPRNTAAGATAITSPPPPECHYRTCVTFRRRKNRMICYTYIYTYIEHNYECTVLCYPLRVVEINAWQFTGTLRTAANSTGGLSLTLNHSGMRGTRMVGNGGGVGEEHRRGGKKMYAPTTGAGPVVLFNYSKRKKIMKNNACCWKKKKIYVI